ncbi:MAG: DUF92 domain-containing protein [Gemmatimonadota bacterium]
MTYVRAKVTDHYEPNKASSARAVAQDFTTHPVDERFVAALILPAVMAAVSWRAAWLTGGGAVAAAVVGAAAVTAGWSWALALLAFFLSSSLLSEWRRKDKAAATGGVIASEPTRNTGQVIANGGVFGAAALVHTWDGSTASALVGFGALASACADTWATEFGTAFGGSPLSLRTCSRVTIGTSGAVTTVGSLAMAGGAGLLGFVTLTVAPAAAWAVFAGGVIGALVDTLLGATIQEERWCVSCRSATERLIHSCGIEAEHRRGLHRFRNDAVNLTSTVVGAAAALAMWRMSA